MSKSHVPVNEDINGPKIATHENGSNEHFQAIIITDGDISDPQPVNPATETTLQSVDSKLTNAATESTLQSVNNNLTVMAVVGHNQLVINDTEVALSTGMVGRRAIEIQNISDLDDSNITFYIGGTGVTSSNGIPIRPGESKAIDSSINLYAICSTGETSLASVLELK